MTNNGTPTIPGYQIEHVLGQGGMARVYLAVQQGFDRPVALKVISPQLASDEEFGRRFLREAKIVGLLSHSNIVPVYDVGEHDGVFYLSMEILTGGDLKEKMKTGIGEDEALAITEQMARALSYAHKKGFIHRDVKPDNVLFRDDNTAVLTDFGIARTAEESEDVTQITQVQSVIGSPKYMSPEQSLGHKLDARTDIYSLGIMLYQMLTGNVPYTGSNVAEISVQRYEQQSPQLPLAYAHLQGLCDKMLAYAPEQRYQNCDDIVRDIENLKHANDQADDATMINTDMTAVRGSATPPSKITPPSTIKPKKNVTASAQGKSLGKKEITVAALTIMIVALGAGWYFSNTGETTAPKTAATETVDGTNLSVEKEASNQADNTDKAKVLNDDLSNEVNAEGNVDPQPLETAPNETASHKITVAGKEVMGKEAIDREVTAREVTDRGAKILRSPQAAEFFAFREAIQSSGPAAAERFTENYPNSVLLDIVKVKAYQDERLVSSLTARAEADDKHAQLTLSELYDAGWGVPKNQRNALDYAKKAASSGQAFALYHYAMLLLANNPSDDQRRIALASLQQAADTGFFLAQTTLAIQYFSGELVSRDVDESIRLFALAGEQGDRNALFNLGQIYDSGSGLDAPDTSTARNYFEQAAALGHPQAADYIE